MRLEILNNEAELEDLKPNEYCITKRYSDDSLFGIIFKCPGCNRVISIGNKSTDGGPGWDIDFTTLTAKPSIVHNKKLGGCGWHGYLTAGELTGVIE